MSPTASTWTHGSEIQLLSILMVQLRSVAPSSRSRPWFGRRGLICGFHATLVPRRPDDFDRIGYAAELRVVTGAVAILPDAWGRSRAGGEAGRTPLARGRPG